MSKITFLMNVHNGERFLRQSIESVLCQSEPDLTFYIRNNSSHDRSGEIIREYAKKDPRIRWMENKVNHLTDDGIHSYERGWWPEFHSKYVAIVDHDDILDVDFLKIMYEAAESNRADMVVCGCTFFEDSTKVVTGYRLPPAISTDDMRTLGPYFIELYGPLRTQWGKIFRTDFFEKYFTYARNMPKELRLSRDTFYILGYLEKCSHFVSLDTALYNYRHSEYSGFFSSKVESFRVHEADILFDRASHCLSSLGIDTDENLNFLYMIHHSHMVELLAIMKKAKGMKLEEKLSLIQEIMSNERLISYSRSPGFLVINEVLSMVEYLLTSDTEDDPSLYRYYIIRIFQSLNLVKSVPVWLSFLFLLSAVCDPENKGKFGEELLINPIWADIPISAATLSSLDPSVQELLTQLPSYKYLSMKSAQPGSDGQRRTLEEALQKAIELEDYDEASARISELSLIDPLNIYVIYNRMFLSCLIGEKGFAQKLSCCAKILWSSHPVITKICEYIETPSPTPNNNH